MKKILMMMFLICSVVTLSAQQESKSNVLDKIFVETKHDFGTVKESNVPVTCIFTYTNTTDKPLIINNVKASCGCTTPEYSKEPLLPGETAQIKVSFNTINRIGAFNKSIFVSTNYGEKVLTIKGVVEK